MFQVELEQEVDGRWIADIPEVPGAMAYGATPAEATAKAMAIARQVMPMVVVPYTLELVPQPDRSKLVYRIVV